jgi:sugar phosphate isomerase/epimerase
VSLISISVAPATAVLGRRYYDLPGSLALMDWLWQRSVVDGFEFQNLAEWDARTPPRDEADKRFAAWEASAKITPDELARQLVASGLPILSVHANRDVGICLCSGDRQEVEHGKRLTHEALALAERVGARVCVFHLWDTWKEAFDPCFLADTLAEVAAAHPAVKASVENVPTQLRGHTPFELVRGFEWITLDLQWAALYDELGRFEPLVDRIANVHLRGRLAGGRWVIEGAPFEFYAALERIRDRWGYDGPLTMEPKGLTAGDRESLVAAMRSLRPPSVP